MVFIYLIFISLFFNVEILCANKLPANGTFIFTKYEDSDCLIVSIANGFTSKSKDWNNPLNDNRIFKPIEYNEERNILTVKNCTSSKTDNLNKIDSCSDSTITFQCDNTCNSMDSYSCNFVSTSSLALFTFTGFSDKGCNNVNGEKYPLKLSTYCWKMHGSGSMSIVDFVKRDLVVNVYENDDCTGAIIQQNKKVNCDEKCINNPINNDDVHYSCKYTNSVFINASFISSLLLVIFYIII